MIPCPKATPRASTSPLWTLNSPLGVRTRRAGDLAWELLLDAATLQNIMHTFPRRSLLGNTDTVWVLGSGTMEKEQHSTALWLHCDCAGWTGYVCGDHVRVPTVGCEVDRMLCQWLRWKKGFTMKQDAAMNLAPSAVVSALLCVPKGLWGLVVLSEIYGWLEYWGEKCGLEWLKGIKKMQGLEFWIQHDRKNGCERNSRARAIKAAMVHLKTKMILDKMEQNVSKKHIHISVAVVWLGRCCCFYAPVLHGEWPRG